MNTTDNRTIRALIVDDEELGRINLRYALSNYPAWHLVGECAGVAESRAILSNANVVDVIFLDIQMPEESGLELARSICAMEEPPLIIFVTAYNIYAVEAFELHALDYLLKPIHNKRLEQTVERVTQMLELKQRAMYGKAVRAYLADEDQASAENKAGYWQQIAVRSIGKLELISVSDIVWICSAGNYVELHTANRIILHRIPLSKLEPHLDPTIFIRVHRASIVRASQCTDLNVAGDGCHVLRLLCGDKITVSERYIDVVRKLFDSK